VAVGGVKLGYAFLADRISLLINSRVYRGINISAGSALIAVGVFVLVKASIS
jgi:threonine/homoserine/homoserine lactone efflux protein